MFWDKWIPVKYLVKSEICAVEACYTDNGVIYYYTHLKNKNNKLELAGSGSSKDELVLPPIIEKNKIPLILIINGKGVILKKVTLGENSNPDFEDIIRRSLPAVNTADFYVQIYKQSDSSAFIALCRKEQPDQNIELIRNKKHDLAAVLVGAPAIIGLKPLWTSYNAIPTTLHLAELSNNELDTISSNAPSHSETIKIDDLVIPFEHTLGMAAGLSYLVQNPIAESSDAAIISIETHHREKNKFRFLMIGAVAIAFVLAIGNVIFYTNYFDKNNKLETELSVYQGKYEQINELLNDYQKNKNLIENAGVLNKNKLSEYGDKIAKTIPDEIVLSELYFNPKKESDESEDSLLTFETGHLVLKGNCSKSFIINEWVNVLKMQKFIKNVNLEKFTYNNEGLLPNFEIRLVTE